MSKKKHRPEKTAPAAGHVGLSKRSSTDALRVRAEAAYREKHAGDPQCPASLSPQAMQSLLHELRVHQIELEMQNEELCRLQAELEASRAKYFHLYDLAPVAYVTLNEEGLIVEANLTARTMLGVDGGARAKVPISRFICSEDQDVFYLMRKRLLAADNPQSCELRMTKKDSPPFWVQMAVSADTDESGKPILRICMQDVTERRHAYELALQSHREMRFLERVAVFINLAKTAREALQVVCREIIDFTGWDFSGTFLPDADGSLALSSWRGYLPEDQAAFDKISEELAEVRWPPGKGALGRILVSKQPEWAHLEDIAAGDPRYPGVNYPLRLGAKSGVAFPIVSGDSAVGVMAFFSRQRMSVEPRMIELLSDIGVQLGRVFERDHAYASLSRSEAFNASVLDSLSEHIAVLDRHGVILAVNAAWREFGINNAATETVANPVGVNYLDACGEAPGGPDREGGAKARAGVLAVLRGERDKFDLEYPCHTPTQQRWFRMCTTRLRLEQGGAVVTHTDITERKLADLALQESENFARAVADHFPGLLAFWDSELRCLFANERYGGWFGRTPAEMRNIQFRELLGEKLFLEREPHIRAALRGEQERFERQLTRPDGEVRETLTDYMPYEKNGRTIGFFSMVTDITSIKRDQERLRERDERLRFLLSATPAVIYTRRAEGDFGLTYVSENVKSVLGYSWRELIDNPAFWEQHIHPDDLQTFRARFIRLFQQERYQLEYRFLHGDGNYRWLQDDIRLIRDSSGAPKILIGSRVDITENRRMKELAIHSEKMLSVAGLASGVAHELNNPLAVMMMNTDAILKRVSPEIAANRAEAQQCGTTIEAVFAYLRQRDVLNMLSSIRASGERAAGIIKNMLAFSRPRTNQMEEHRLEPLIDQAWELARNEFQLKKSYDVKRVELVRNYDPRLPPILCHPTEIQQVFLNLFKNAVQAMAGRAAHPRITIRTSLEENQVRVMFEDNGPGIPENIRKQVFDPFFTTKSPAEGNGLGLFISYFIISRSHRGTISVSSPPGGGAQFEITVPLN